MFLDCWRKPVSGDAWRTCNNANYRLVYVNAKQRHSFIRFQHLGSEHLLIFGLEWILKIMMYFFSPLGISTEGMPTNSSNKPNIRGITQVALLTPELSSLLLFVWNKPSNRRREVTVVDKLQWSTIVFDTALINILCCCFFSQMCCYFFSLFVTCCSSEAHKLIWRMMSEQARRSGRRTQTASAGRPQFWKGSEWKEMPRLKQMPGACGN